MLGDAEIQSLSDNLKAHLLAQFGCLLESYSALKSDYEEEKDGRERYKKLARSQDRNPFVLMLVDGDGYLFKESLIKSGAQGAIRELAQELLGSVADQCRVMFEFTRAQDLFDYVDAGDKKEGADYKIREMSRLFVENNQCKHIFFAGCHDTGYLSLLAPYRGNADRITLSKAASFHHEFNQLDFAICELPDGKCRYENECKWVHEDPTMTEEVSSSCSTESDNGDINYTGPLPCQNTNSLHSIAVNRLGDRLDEYVFPPSHESCVTYGKRAELRRPRNNYHLGGNCNNESCIFDHDFIDAESLHVLQKGNCRSLKCYFSHHYQKDGCEGDSCRFSRGSHAKDLNVAEWVEPTE
ncbi:hypothetical protein BDW74DRAFT_170548 [Aspergillus multicolor]|uniref:uncharacterized protein n=1 Tax=Aspergillus multicolor TaxID=41759 RepID=UPI003CCD0CFD